MSEIMSLSGFPHADEVQKSDKITISKQFKDDVIRPILKVCPLSVYSCVQAHKMVPLLDGGSGT